MEGGDWYRPAAWSLLVNRVFALMGLQEGWEVPLLDASLHLTLHHLDSALN